LSHKNVNSFVDKTDKYHNTQKLEGFLMKGRLLFNQFLFS